MKPRIGVIGPLELTNRVLDLAREIPSFDAVGFPYTSEREARSIAIDLQPDVDGLLFTGVIPYRLTQVSGELHRPAQFIPLNGASLYRVLIQASIAGHDVTRASIDTLTDWQVREAYADVGLDAEHVATLPYRDGVTAEELYDFHRNKRAVDEAEFAISCLHSACELLRVVQPTYWLIPAVHSIRMGLQAIAADVERAEQGFSQVAIAIVEFGGDAQGDESGLVATEAAALGGSAVLVAPGRYMIMTTRGAVEAATIGFTRAPILLHIPDHGRTLRVGYGVGRSAREAEHHADRALRRARAIGDVAGVVALANDTIRSLDTGSPVPRSDSAARLARQIGVSEATIQGLRQVAQMQPDGVIAASDVSRHFGITLRSGRRIIERVERFGLAHEISSRRDGSVGRPKSLYRLDV